MPGQVGVPVALDHAAAWRPRTRPEMGLKRFKTFLHAGLPAPQLRRDAPVGGGPGWPGFAYVADTVRSLLPFLERVGTVRPDEVAIDTLKERLCAEVAGQDGLQLLPAIVGPGLAPEPQRHSGESCPT